MFYLFDNSEKGLNMKTLGKIVLMLGLVGMAQAKEVYLTIGSDALQGSQKSFTGVKVLDQNSEITVIKIDEKNIEALSHMMHEDFNRCGGFIVHESEEEAKSVLADQLSRRFAKSLSFVSYSITEGQKVNTLVNQTSELNIRDMIASLTSYQNRYYKAQTGVDSQGFVKKTWEKLAAGRTDVSVELYQHTKYPQPSVIMTIEGSIMKDEIVIIGGHGDSIAGWWGREKARAPGADDNASGISTITEIIRVLMSSGYKPQRTIKFMSYAAEEVGLLGSNDIAKEFKAQSQNVVGVVQFDMTNYKGTDNLDIVFMTDFTNEAQTKFMGSLIDTYIPTVSWGYSKCGYGCSDHASWHNAGYPASMPFESTMGDINRNIHTKNDTIDVDRSGGNADHAEKFAKLGIAFAVEMGK